MSKISLEINEIWELAEPVISSNGEFRLFHKGVSMMPLLRQGIDSVVLTKLDREPQKYDIVAYRRPNGQIVIHRIMKIRKDECIMCGDNHGELEYGITKNNILAVVKGIYRDEEYVDLATSKWYKKYLKKLPFQHFRKKHIDVFVDHLLHPEKRKYFKKKK